MKTVLVIVLNTMLTGFLPTLHARDSEPRETIRVLSYNIHMWQPGVQNLAKLIRSANADVVGLNEAWNEKRNEEIADELGYNVVYGGRTPEKESPKKPHSINGHYMPQVLLTKHKIVKSRCFNAMAAKEHPAFNPEVPIYRGGLLAVLETEGGNQFVIFVLHLHPWGDGENEKMTSMRLAEIMGILKTLKPYQHLPILIIGDFNTRSHLDEKGGWETTKELESNGFQDLFRNQHPNAVTHPGLTCGKARIDYIFHNNRFRTTEARVVADGVFQSKGYGHSDHLALFGTVKFKDRR